MFRISNKGIKAIRCSLAQRKVSSACSQSLSARSHPTEAVLD
jgi:hypothetical protein